MAQDHSFRGRRTKIRGHDDGAASAPPGVEVIVLCKNEGSGLRGCLEAILAQHLPVPFSVTVIDSGSTDGSLALARALPVRLLEIPAAAFHHARTRNLGAEQTQAPILVYTNGHALPVGPFWLAHLTAPLRAAPAGELAGVYGRQLPRPDAYPMERFMLSWLYGVVARIQRADPGKTLGFAQTLFSTVNCALRRDLWQRRPFSDRVGTAEDQEWSRYWLQQGYAIAYEPQAAVVHSHNESLSRAFHRAYEAGRWSAYSYLPRDGRASMRFMLSNLKRLAEEAAFLASEGYASWLPYATLYEGTRILGWTIGREYSWLPESLRRALGGLVLGHE